MWANSVNSLVFLHSVIRNLKCMQWSQMMWNKYWSRRYFSLFSQLTWSATAPARNRNEKRATHTTASKLPLAPAQVLFEKKEKRGNTAAFWHALEKVLRKVKTKPWWVQCREAWSNVRKSGKWSALAWHAPSSGTPWQDSPSIEKHSFQTLLCLSYLCSIFGLKS